jgi:hypothetical protein
VSGEINGPGQEHDEHDGGVTLAAYEVENLWQRSYTFGKQSNMYRNLGDAEAEKNIQKSASC